MSYTHESDDELREQAARQLKKRHDFHGHLLVYVLVNAFLVTIWFVLSPDGFFWPVFPLVGWGIGVVMNAWDVYARPVREDDIDREVRRLQRRR
jgi:hypothetical protein